MRKNLILPETTVVGIQTFGDMARLAHDLRVRPDWHEPDEQGVDARIIGHSLDNAMGSTVREIGENNEAGEFNVIITREGVDVAVINLANLLAWASLAMPRELRTWEKSE
jgi:hypothetical protein